MNNASDPKAWVARAEEDYLLAVSSVRRKTALTYGATFHSQQCAEKYLTTSCIAWSTFSQDT